MPDNAPEAEARQFAAQFSSFLDWIHSIHREDDRSEVSTLVGGFLGRDGAAQSVVTRELAPFEHVNLQTALDAWSARPGRTVEVRGLTLPPHHAVPTLQQLVAGDDNGLQLSPPALIDLPNGPGSTLGCLKLALLLVTEPDRSFIVMVRGPGEHDPGLELEVAGLPVDAAQRVLAEFDELRSELNVYRGHLLEVTLTQAGVSLGFAVPSGLGRDDVVLPDAVLAAGQHLKRGLLLYGPPGTGKTHTTRYLLGQMTSYTRLVLTGRALVAVGAVTEMARALAPAVLVLEDVDLVAEERALGARSNPVLFDLLDAMDGAAGDADLLFLLTTNRADLLEL